jgi:tight adherence protein B
MLELTAAVLAFVVIASLGWVFVGGEDSSGRAVKRAQAFGNPKKAQAAARAAAANTPEQRRKQIMDQLKESDRKERKARVTMAAKLRQAGLSMKMRTFIIFSVMAGLVSGLVALVLGLNPLLAIGVALVTGLGLPRWVVGFLGKRRMKKFSGEFANAVDVIVRGIKSGLPVPDWF